MTTTTSPIEQAAQEAYQKYLDAKAGEIAAATLLAKLKDMADTRNAAGPFIEKLEALLHVESLATLIPKYDVAGFRRGGPSATMVPCITFPIANLKLCLRDALEAHELPGRIYAAQWCEDCHRPNVESKLIHCGVATNPESATKTLLAAVGEYVAKAFGDVLYCPPCEAKRGL